MKVFVIGKTAREQAFIEQISKSKRCEGIFCAPANPAIAAFASCVNIAMSDISSMLEFAFENQVDLTVVFDEDLISRGIVNIFQDAGLRIFAPTREAAQIALSRAFAKKFLYKQKVPILKYGVFDKENSALDFLKKSTYPVFIKTDVKKNDDAFYCTTFGKAKKKLDEIFDNDPQRIVIEEYIEGQEFTVSVLTDGYQVLPLGYVKKIFDSSFGEEISFTPVAQITAAIENIIAQKIIFPVIDALQAQKNPYVGFLSLKFLVCSDGAIYALDFSASLNVDEAVLFFQMIDDDLLDIVYIASEGALEDFYSSINISDDVLVASIISAPNANMVVEGIEKLDADGIALYYNDVGMNINYEISTNGKNAFYMTSAAATLTKSIENLKENMRILNFR